MYKKIGVLIRVILTGFVPENFAQVRKFFIAVSRRGIKLKKGLIAKHIVVLLIELGFNNIDRGST